MAKPIFKFTNGRIWDGEQFLTGTVTVDPNTGTILSIGEDTNDDPSAVMYDAAGQLICPGLVDIHTHFKGISTDLYGMQAEMACFPFGVTAAAECGAEKGDRSLSDLLMVRNVVFGVVPIVDDHADFTLSEQMERAYGSKMIGLKTYYDVHSSDVRSIRPLQEICERAREKNYKVTVHCNHSPVSMKEILETLNPGDILTHIYHGGANSAAQDHFECLKEAQKRGIILDTGFAGHVHTDFAILKDSIEAGFLPNTISTDITCLSAYMRGGIYGLTLCMSLMRSSGVPEEKILRAVTSDAAAALDMPEWGHLRVGGPADLTILSYGPQHFSLKDEEGHIFSDENGYICQYTMVGGQTVYRRSDC